MEETPLSVTGDKENGSRVLWLIRTGRHQRKEEVIDQLVSKMEKGKMKA